MHTLGDLEEPQRCCAKKRSNARAKRGSQAQEMPAQQVFRGSLQGSFVTNEAYIARKKATTRKEMCCQHANRAISAPICKTEFMLR